MGYFILSHPVDNGRTHDERMAGRTTGKHDAVRLLLLPRIQDNAGLENARLKKAAPNCRGGKCGTGKRGTKTAGVENARLENAGTTFFMESQACLLVWFADTSVSSVKLSPNLTSPIQVSN